MMGTPVYIQLEVNGENCFVLLFGDREHKKSV